MNIRSGSHERLSLWNKENDSTNLHNTSKTTKGRTVLDQLPRPPNMLSIHNEQMAKSKNKNFDFMRLINLTIEVTSLTFFE